MFALTFPRRCWSSRRFPFFHVVNAPHWRPERSCPCDIHTLDVASVIVKYRESSTDTLYFRTGKVCVERVGNNCSRQVPKSDSFLNKFTKTPPGSSMGSVVGHQTQRRKSSPQALAEVKVATTYTYTWQLSLKS